MIDPAAIKTRAALELSAEALEQAETEFRRLGCNALAALMGGRARTARAALPRYETAVQIGELVNPIVEKLARGMRKDAAE